MEHICFDRLFECQMELKLQVNYIVMNLVNRDISYIIYGYICSSVQYYYKVQQCLCKLDSITDDGAWAHIIRLLQQRSFKSQSHNLRPRHILWILFLHLWNPDPKFLGILLNFAVCRFWCLSSSKFPDSHFPRLNVWGLIVCTVFE